MDNVGEAIKKLSLPDTNFIRQRTTKALALLEKGKIHPQGNGQFKVSSQSGNNHYSVDLNNRTCTCGDSIRTINCKHQIACLLLEEKPAIEMVCDDTKNSFLRLGRWQVADYPAKTYYQLCRGVDNSLSCPCGQKPDCEHREVVRQYCLNKAWFIAYWACLNLTGNKGTIDANIHGLILEGKLRQASPHEYDKDEWKLIYEECRKEGEKGNGPHHSWKPRAVRQLVRTRRDNKIKEGVS